MNIVNEDFFTSDAIGHFASALAALVIVTRAIRQLFGADRHAITFFVALLIAYLAAGATGKLGTIPWQEVPSQQFFAAALCWVVPLVNACFLFMAALGASRIV